MNPSRVELSGNEDICDITICKDSQTTICNLSELISRFELFSAFFFASFVNQ